VGCGGTSGRVTDDSETFKADSLVACRARAVPLLCRAIECVVPI
jgi:hypothetical protein